VFARLHNGVKPDHCLKTRVSTLAVILRLESVTTGKNCFFSTLLLRSLRAVTVFWVGNFRTEKLDPDQAMSVLLFQKFLKAQ